MNETTTDRELKKARHARQAAALRALVADGTIKAWSRDDSGNRIEDIIHALERSASK